MKTSRNLIQKATAVHAMLYPENLPKPVRMDAPPQPRAVPAQLHPAPTPIAPLQRQPAIRPAMTPAPPPPAPSGLYTDLMKRHDRLSPRHQ